MSLTMAKTLLWLSELSNAFEVDVWSVLMVVLFVFLTVSSGYS